ncbi:MAG: DEAD/DEAH box helicase [Acidimicrobiaceae bacterium]|nr:DEAD/DEAH box helicase [Acidimicrobiaceae bacterium]MYI36023.1 DEAD/DEAH box helicase [Acidimicrobiaceae bacterium]
MRRSSAPDGQRVRGVVGVPGSVGQSDLGRFVVGESELGIGRLVGVDGATARIRYFRGPVKEPYVERESDLQRVAVAEIRAHSRVYFHDGHRWRIGRVDGEHRPGDEQYVVALPNREGEILSSDQFDIRWAPRIEDPYEILAALGGASPRVYEPRVDLLASWHALRAAAAGVDGLLLGSVELHDHQLTVVRSVSDDHERRYLLADEVGLGKTVEAGAIVWQSLRDRPTGEVLVLTPDHLRQQWAEELIGKFHVDRFPRASIRIRAHEEPETWPDGPVGVLVVDEAHHLTRAGPLPTETLVRMTELAHGARDVLLLSATPVRTNEVAFLDLLHLLDPKNYQPQDLGEFTRRVEMRDELALIHHSLTPDLDEFDFSLYADQLRSVFPDDKALDLLIGQALDCTDSQRPDRIVRVREHLSETYRLHHRLLRTRRSPQISASFGVRGRRRGRPFTVEISDDSDELRADLIEGFRLHVAELVESGEVEIDRAIEALRVLGQACGSLPHAILEFTARDESEGAIGVVSHWLASSGEAWRRELEALAPIVLDATALQIGRMAIAKALGKVVVASAYPAVAQAVSSAVAGSFGRHRVAEHLNARSRDENAASVDRWRCDESCRLLVCDASAEEGINLQTADVVIHLDLPWDVFRLEQRLGRADRFVRGKLQPVESMVFMYGDQAYASGWFLFAADSCGVFDQSVSSLQYVLADLESEVLAQAITGRAGVFDSDIESRRERLHVEEQRIAAHDSLDSVSGLHRGLNERLLDEDANPRLGAALKAWLTGVGAKTWSPAKGSLQIAGRPRPQVPFALERAMAPWFGTEVALARRAAVDRKAPIVRPGHGLLDAIVNYLRDDDRGLAFAFMRPVRGCWPPTAVLRTDFLVRGSTTHELDRIAREQGIASWLQVQHESFVPPVLETVYMSDQGLEVDSASATRPYENAKGDRNLMWRPEMFDELTEHLDWEAVCGQGLTGARRILDSRDSVEPRAARAATALRSSIDGHLAALRARAETDLEPADEQVQAFEALALAVPDQLEMVVDVIGCGVIVLADPGRIGE